MPIHSRHSLWLQHVWAAIQLTSLCCQYTIAFMSQSATKPANAFWTNEETGALLNHLYHHWSESEGAGGFNNAVFQSAIPELLPFYERGAPRRLSTSRANGNSCICPDFMHINVINIQPAQKHPQCDQYLVGEVRSSLGWWEGMQYFPWDGGGLGRSYASQGGFEYLIYWYL